MLSQFLHTVVVFKLLSKLKFTNQTILIIIIIKQIHPN